MTDNLIEIEGLRYSRGDRIIFDGLNLEVPRGRITALMGPSGTGKTTLLRIIGGQIRPDSGRVIVDGLDVPTLSRGELFELRRNMGMLFQSSALFTDLSVFENVAFPLRVHTNLPDEMVRDLVLMKLNAVGLRGARDLMPSQLSGGMSRRVALARTMALDPKFIMYDEPFTGSGSDRDGRARLADPRLERVAGDDEPRRIARHPRDREHRRSDVHHLRRPRDR